MTPPKSSLFVNALSNWISIAVSILTSFILTPFIIYHLGASGYGIWVLVSSIVGYYGLLDLGLHSATIRYVAHYLGKTDSAWLSRIVNTSVALYLAIGFSVILISFLIAGPLSHFFQVNPAQVASFQVMIYLVGTAAGIGFPRRVFDAVLMAHERFVLLNTLEIVCHILRAAVIFLTLYNGWGLEGIGWSELGTEIFNFSTKLLIMFSMRKGLRFSMSGVAWKAARALMTFGLLTFITLIGDMLRFNIDSAIIGRYLTMDAVGIYGIGITLIRVLTRASNACSVVTFPRLSRLAGENIMAFRSSYMDYSRWISILITGMSLELVLLAPNFIRFWVGPSFDDSALITMILAGALATDFCTSVSINALKALNHLRFYAAQTLVEGFAKLGLSILLIQVWGITGVAVATAVPLLVSKVIVQPVYTSWRVGVPWRDYFSLALARPALAAIAVGVPAHFSGFFRDYSFLNLIAEGSFIAAAFSVAAYFMCLTRRDREVLKQWLGQPFRVIIPGQKVAGVRNPALSSEDE